MEIATPQWKFRDFFDEVDAMVPAWRLPATLADTSTSRTDAPMIYPENASSQRVMHSLVYAPYASPDDGIDAGQPLTLGNSGPWTTEFSMPFALYVRAMDPAGSITTLAIKSCQNPNEDQTGYDQRIVTSKRKQGWLICERSPMLQALGLLIDFGMPDAEYGEYLRAEWLRRRRARAAFDAREKAKMQTDAERAIVDQQKKQTEILSQQGDMTRAMVAEMVTTLIPEITKAVLSGVRGDADRGDEPKGKRRE